MDTLPTSPLPDDVPALRQLVIEQGFMIEKLKYQLGMMNRHRFGASSEGVEQLDLLVEDMEVAQAEFEAALED